MTTAEFFQQKFRELFEAYKATGGTQSSLAVAAGVKQSQVSVWLKGGYLPGIESLDGLARAFGVPVSTFFPADKADPLPTDVREDILTVLQSPDGEGFRELLRMQAEAIRSQKKSTKAV